MGTYVDVCVIPVPKAKLAAYRALAETSAEVWREHGALSYVECEADDVKPGKLTSFPQSLELQAGETVVIAWITYPSRAVRDAVNAKVMQDPRIGGLDHKTMPFDTKRMFFGGFSTFIDA
jgi:uncharacterized protein YbaA (DUF1428 family)